MTQGTGGALNGAGVAPIDARPARGYLETATASLLNGTVGVMVSYAAMPTGMLVPVRMLFAGLFLAPLALRPARLAELRAPGIPVRLLGMGLLLAGTAFFYFLAIRQAGVAAAIFLTYMAPVYLAVLAPRMLGERTDRATVLALIIALTGMVTIVLPRLFADSGGITSLGVAAGVASGLFYGANLLALKRMHGRVASSAMVWIESLVAAAVLLPLGVYEVLDRGYALRGMDLLMAGLLGLISAAVGFTLFVHGLKFIKVQHGSIIGYLEPVSAPLYALAFLGQRPGGWTISGGTLIVLAGVLLVVRAQAVEAPA